jgi:hypothetical protein
VLGWYNRGLSDRESKLRKTSVAALLVYALSVAAAIFLILEMDRPFDGLIKVSAEPARNALAHMRP